MAESYNAKPIQLDNTNNETLMKMGDQMRQERMYQMQLARENKKQMIAAQAGVDNTIHQQGWLDSVNSEAGKAITTWAAQNVNRDPETFQIELNKKVADWAAVNSAVKNQQDSSKAIADKMAEHNPGLDAATLQKEYLKNAIFDKTDNGGFVLKPASRITSDPKADMSKLLQDTPEVYFNADAKTGNVVGTLDDVAKYHSNPAYRTVAKELMETRDAKGKVIYDKADVEYNSRIQKVKDGKIILNTDPETGLINSQAFEDLDVGRMHAELTAKAHRLALDYNDPNVTEEHRAALIGGNASNLPSHVDINDPSQMAVLRRAILTSKLQNLGSKKSDVDKLLAPVTKNYIKIDSGAPAIKMYDRIKGVVDNEDAGYKVRRRNPDGSSIALGTPLSKIPLDAQARLIDLANEMENKTDENDNKEKLTQKDLIITKDNQGEINLSLWDPQTNSVGRSLGVIDRMGTDVAANSSLGIKAKAAAAKDATKQKITDWNAAWANLPKGGTMVGLNGKTLTKK